MPEAIQICVCFYLFPASIFIVGVGKGIRFDVFGFRMFYSIKLGMPVYIVRWEEDWDRRNTATHLDMTSLAMNSESTLYCFEIELRWIFLFAIRGVTLDHWKSTNLVLHTNTSTQEHFTLNWNLNYHVNAKCHRQNSKSSLCGDRIFPWQTMRIDWDFLF